MKFYIPARQLLFIMLLSGLSISIHAQYISPNDKNGNRKSAYDIKAEEARNKQNNNYKPASTPVKTPSRSNDEVEPAKAPRPDYGKYDFRDSPDENGMQIVKLNGNWGFTSAQDKIILPLIYEKVIYRGNGWYEIISEKKSGMANKQGMVVIPCQFNLIYTIFDKNGQAKVNKNGQTYFINQKGQPVMEANQLYAYHEVMGKYSEGMALVSLRDIDGARKYGFLDSTNEIKIPLTYDNATSFHKGIALVKSGMDWGAINKNGEIIIPTDYKKIDRAGDLFIVTQNEKIGVIDKTGKIIIPLIYEQSGLSFEEGCICMKLNGAWGFVDSISGREIVPFKYVSAGYFREGLAVVSKQEKMFSVSYGFVNKTGVEVIPLVYEEANAFFGGLAAVMQNGLWGFIDRQQNIIVKFMYDDIRKFNEGLAAVRSKGKWGYIDRTGKLVIPYKYDDTYAIFNEGQISVKTGEKWGSINNKGEETIPPLYNNHFQFRNGEAFVRLGKESLSINEKGTIVATQEWVNGKYVRVPIRPTEKPAPGAPVRIYETVKIGKNLWTNVNLDESVFRNGDAIPEARTAIEWVRAANLNAAAWCYLNFDPANGKKYGKLYNWYAVNDPRGLAPMGMHIPTDAEWTKMTKGLDPKKDAGDKLKDSTGWGRYVNKNETGFSGLPGGYYADGKFQEAGDRGYWWSATEHNIQLAYVRGLIGWESYVHLVSFDKRSGLSVRCVKD